MAPLKTDVWNQVLAIAVLGGEELTQLGTGFLIGQSLAFTAAHVISDPFFRKSKDEDCFVVAYQVVNRGQTPLLWSIRRICRFPSVAGTDDRPLDIALLKLERHGEPVAEIEKHRRMFFGMNVAPPKVGQPVVAYGFAKSTIQSDPANPLVFDVGHTFRRVEGQVSEIRSPYRDLALMPFPCFSVNADFEAGMSGGPVFNSQDQICGIVSSGGIGGVSWASILWPSLAIKCEGTHLLDLARNGRIRARNHHCVSLRPNGEEPAPTVVFEHDFELP